MKHRKHHTKGENLRLKEPRLEIWSHPFTGYEKVECTSYDIIQPDVEGTAELLIRLRGYYSIFLPKEIPVHAEQNIAWTKNFWPYGSTKIRGRGVASKLLDIMVQDARMADCGGVIALPSEEYAKFLLRKGFTEIRGFYFQKL